MAVCAAEGEGWADGNCHDRNDNVPTTTAGSSSDVATTLNDAVAVSGLPGFACRAVIEAGWQGLPAAQPAAMSSVGLAGDKAGSGLHGHRGGLQPSHAVGAEAADFCLAAGTQRKSITIFFLFFLTVTL